MRTAALAALLSLSFSVACTDDSDVCGTDEDCADAALMNQAYEEGQQEGKADGTDCSGVRVPDTKGFAKHVFLTFDDGPNPATTPQIISILKAHHAPATFFNNGSRHNSAAAKALAAQIAADPDYILGNHTQNHLDLSRQSESKVASEIDQTDALLRAAGATPKYLRFPFGASTCASAKQARDRGYFITGWHIDSADWCYSAGGGYCKPATFQYVPDAMRGDYKAYVLSQARQYGGGIILMHDIHSFTVQHLDEVLTALEAEGFTFGRLDDTTLLPRLNGITPPPPTFVGTPCTTDAQCAFSGGRCHAAGFCTMSCQGYCPDAAGAAPTFCIADTENDGAGICVSKPAAQNNQCAALPGTEKVQLPRFIGTSSAPASAATVCAPAGDAP